MTKKKVVATPNKRDLVIKKALKEVEILLNIKPLENDDFIHIGETSECIKVEYDKELTTEYFFFEENPDIPKDNTAVWVKDTDDDDDTWVPRVSTGNSSLKKPQWIETYDTAGTKNKDRWDLWRLKNPNKRENGKE